MVATNGQTTIWQLEAACEIRAEVYSMVLKGWCFSNDTMRVQLRTRLPGGGRRGGRGGHARPGTAALQQRRRADVSLTAGEGESPGPLLDWMMDSCCFWASNKQKGLFFPGRTWLPWRLIGIMQAHQEQTIYPSVFKGKIKTYNKYRWPDPESLHPFHAHWPCGKQELW